MPAPKDVWGHSRSLGGTQWSAYTEDRYRHATLLADLGAEKAARADPALALGVNIYKGQITCEPVASSLSLPYRPLSELID